ncbi:hypothetical protein [Haloplanus rallus]|uniref:hypothetical protein n=1 Tax=Haloplanus rallus TaxID=1816183 RepID=UPI001E2D354D|nr:hypothetical protein [Haloplanus rallus]
MHVGSAPHARPTRYGDTGCSSSDCWPGVVGIVLFLPSSPASALREASIAMGGLGLAVATPPP